MNARLLLAPPREAIFDGLVALFADRRLPAEAVSGGLELVQRFYKDLSFRESCT